MTVLCYLASLALMFGAAIARPDHARCPRGYWLDEGVRSSGDFACRPVPVGAETRDARGILRDHSVQAPGELRSRVYCTGGMRAITSDGVAVGCQRLGW